MTETTEVLWLNDAWFINSPVRAFPDLTGFAPKGQAWMAYNTQTYDGSPDAGEQIVGWGPSKNAAIKDYYNQVLA
jgi:hypothetical protein